MFTYIYVQRLFSQIVIIVLLVLQAMLTLFKHHSGADKSLKIRYLKSFKQFKDQNVM